MKITEMYEQISKIASLKPKEKAQYIKDLYENHIISDDSLSRLICIWIVQFDPTIKTSLDKKSMKKKIKGDKSTTRLQDFDEFLLYITNNCTGTDDNIQTVQNYINECRDIYPEKICEFLENIAMQNLKIGITGEGINKAIGRKIIYTYNVWKGQALKDYDKLKGRDVIVTPKLDGYRAHIFLDEVISPNGLREPLSLYPEIEKEMNKISMRTRRKYIFDGEMLYNGKESISRIDRYNKTSSIVGSKSEKRNLCFHMFDMIDKEAFDNDIDKTPTILRKNNLKDTLFELDEYNKDIIQYVEPLYTGNDVEIIKELFAEAINNGDEGLMIQTTYAPYETRKVSDGMWKLKVRDTADVRVVGFEEGKETGKNKGTLGNMLVEYKGSICGVGSGFKELPSEKYPITHTRDYIWQHQDEFIGKIVEIEFDENKDKNGNYNLRHAVFLRWREDKNEPSLD